MRDLVLDATVVIPWFDPKRPAGTEAAPKLRTQFEAGVITVAVPSLLRLEVLNVAGRQWSWNESALATLANDLEHIGFEFSDPALPLVAAWVARGLTAYDATYIALAESRGLTLLTTDPEMLRIGHGIAERPH